MVRKYYLLWEYLEMALSHLCKRQLKPTLSTIQKTQNSENLLFFQKFLNFINWVNIFELHLRTTGEALNTIKVLFSHKILNSIISFIYFWSLNSKISQNKHYYPKIKEFILLLKYKWELHGFQKYYAPPTYSYLSPSMVFTLLSQGILFRALCFCLFGAIIVKTHLQ